MKLSVAIPCLNEAQTIEKAVGLARDLVAAVGGDGEIVVGDNGSTDGSRELAERAGARVAPASRRGLRSRRSASRQAAKANRYPPPRRARRR